MSGRVDVVVVGGGPAGVATALGCARRGLEVALLDRARFPRDKPCGEGLLPAAVRALSQLRLLGRVRPLASPLDGIAFGLPDGTRARARFCDAAGGPALGLGVRRLQLDAALIAAARAEPGVTVLEGARATGLLRDGDRVAGVRSTAGTLQARVVAIADGLRSPLRAALGLDRPPPRNARLGLRLHLRVPSLPFGRDVFVLVAAPFEYYLTPVAAGELQVAVLGGRDAFERARLSAITLLAHLRAHPYLGPRLDGAEPLDRALGAGPFAQQARALVLDGALLVGDAAGYLDAITGEGIGLALDSGRAAADAIAGALAHGAATARALAGYPRARAAIVRDAERLTRLVLLLARHPWLARRAVHALARSEALFQRLLRVQAGAPLASVPVADWARLLAG